MNKIGTNFSQNSYIFIQENVFENVVWKTAAVFSRPQCVNVSALEIMCEQSQGPWRWQAVDARFKYYRQIFNIMRTKSQHLNVSRFVL